MTFYCNNNYYGYYGIGVIILYIKDLKKVNNFLVDAIIEKVLLDNSDSGLKRNNRTHFDNSFLLNEYSTIRFIFKNEKLIREHNY